MADGGDAAGSQESALSPSANDICPSCGKLVEKLNEITGWCDACNSNIDGLGYVGDGDSPSERSIQRYLEVNADRLEHHISQGSVNSLDKAIKYLADPKNGYRPTCVVCGCIIKHAPKTSVFCRRTKECRRMSRRYIYLYRERKPPLTKAEALALIIEELTGE